MASLRVITIILFATWVYGQNQGSSNDDANSSARNQMCQEKYNNTNATGKSHQNSCVVTCSYKRDTGFFGIVDWPLGQVNMAIGSSCGEGRTCDKDRSGVKCYNTATLNNCKSALNGSEFKGMHDSLKPCQVKCTGDKNKEANTNAEDNKSCFKGFFQTGKCNNGTCA